MKGRITFALLMLLVSIWGFASPKIAISPEYEANKRLAAIVFESILNHCDHDKLKEYYKLYKDFRPSFKILIDIKGKSYINLRYIVDDEQEAEKYFDDLNVLIKQVKNDLISKDAIYIWVDRLTDGFSTLYNGMTKEEVMRKAYDAIMNRGIISTFNLQVMDSYFIMPYGKESDFKTENNTFDFLKRMVSKYRNMKVRTYKDIYGF